MIKKLSIILLVCITLTLAACSSFNPNTYDTATATDATASDAITYDAKDNSIEALMSRAVSVNDSKYLVSHWGNSKCHIVIGAKETIDNKIYNTVISKDDINIDRLVNCTIGSDNICSECGYHYTKEENNLETKEQIIAKQNKEKEKDKNKEQVNTETTATKDSADKKKTDTESNK